MGLRTLVRAIALFGRYAWIATGAGLVVLGIIGKAPEAVVLGLIAAAVGMIWSHVFDS